MRASIPDFGILPSLALRDDRIHEYLSAPSTGSDCAAGLISGMELLHCTSGRRNPAPSMVARHVAVTTPYGG